MSLAFMISNGGKWTLNHDALERLLAALGPDREAASRRYEEIRRRLIHFFDWRGSPAPDVQADETLDRVARKIQEGTAIEDVTRYTCVVARYVLHESERQRARERAASTEIGRDATAVRPSDDAERRAACLQKCLAGLPAQDRALIEAYYRGRGRVHLDERKALARRLGLTYSGLKMRAFRIRGVLLDCLRICLGPGRSGDR